MSRPGQSALVVLLLQAVVGGEEPSLEHSLTTPVIRQEGQDALLTCVANHQANYTLMWKRAEKDKVKCRLYCSSTVAALLQAGNRILTANTERITSDPRLSVMHEPGGQVYVLVIKNVTMADAGLYICELNSDPVPRSFHELKVLSPSLQPPLPPSSSDQQQTATKDSLEVWNFSTESPISHDFTACCASSNVSSSCQAFCHVKQILDGSTGVDPAECEQEFPAIVKCMADGRDHLPCCLDQGVSH